MKKSKKKESDAFDGRIWGNILDFNVNIDAQLISKSNFIFGASTLILIFILERLVNTGIYNINSIGIDAMIQNIPLFILLIGTFFSSLFAILIVLPKLRIFSKKDRNSKDVFYYKNIIKFYSGKSYLEYLKDLPLDNKRIGEAYAHQIYALAKNVIPYKFKLLKISGWILISSIILSLLSYFIILMFRII